MGLICQRRLELIAHGRTEEEVGQLIGADRIFYQDLEDLKDACREVNPDMEAFDCSVFDGNYVTGDIDDAYLAVLEASRNDAAKIRARVTTRWSICIIKTTIWTIKCHATCGAQVARRRNVCGAIISILKSRLE
ncbi:hypothetical protein HAALTHF_34570n [Vreelandella aquamarina]|nr:hypothetical protein HAALTHF_34570n [Halomonas axialensis]